MSPCPRSPLPKLKNRPNTAPRTPRSKLSRPKPKPATCWLRAGPWRACRWSRARHRPSRQGPARSQQVAGLGLGRESLERGVRGAVFGRFFSFGSGERGHGDIRRPGDRRHRHVLRHAIKVRRGLRREGEGVFRLCCAAAVCVGGVGGSSAGKLESIWLTCESFVPSSS